MYTNELWAMFSEPGSYVLLPAGVQTEAYRRCLPGQCEQGFVCVRAILSWCP